MANVTLQSAINTISSEIDSVVSSVSAKQDKISTVGNTNLLLAPSSAGGQPSSKPVSDFVLKSEVQNSLTSTSTNTPLSANQGKVLQDTKSPLNTTLSDNSSDSLPATASGTLVSKIQALRDNIKFLFSRGGLLFSRNGTVVGVTVAAPSVVIKSQPLYPPKLFSYDGQICDVLLYSDGNSDISGEATFHGVMSDPVSRTCYGELLLRYSDLWLAKGSGVLSASGTRNVLSYKNLISNFCANIGQYLSSDNIDLILPLSTQAIGKAILSVKAGQNVPSYFMGSFEIAQTDNGDIQAEGGVAISGGTVCKIIWEYSLRVSLRYNGSNPYFL
jgi:hypothetical protein